MIWIGSSPPRCWRDSWAGPLHARFSSPIRGPRTCSWPKPIGRGAGCWAAARDTQTKPRAGYGRNTGIADACDLAWKLAALVRGFGGPGLLHSYDAERRPVGLRNRQASGRHTQVRLAIAQAYHEAGNSLEEASAEADS